MLKYARYESSLANHLTGYTPLFMKSIERLPTRICFLGFTLEYVWLLTKNIDAEKMLLVYC